MSKDIEKESLEAHVEICNMKHDNLTDQVERNLNEAESDHKEMRDNLDKLSVTVQQIRDQLHEHINGTNIQVIRWGIGVVGSLIAALAALTFMYIDKGGPVG